MSRDLSYLEILDTAIEDDFDGSLEAVLDAIEEALEVLEELGY